MAKYTDREALQIFVEMSDRLLKSKFVADIKTRTVGNSIQITNLGRTMTTSEPDQDMVHAALLTLRMFGQDNDTISFRNISARIATLPVDPALKAEFDKARNDLNNNLDSPPSVQVEGEPNAATRRLIFDTFLYGEYAHSNAEKRAVVQRWKQQPFYFTLTNQFVLTMVFFIAELLRAKLAVEKMLADKSW